MELGRGKYVLTEVIDQSQAIQWRFRSNEVTDGYWRSNSTKRPGTIFEYFVLFFFRQQNRF